MARSIRFAAPALLALAMGTAPLLAQQPDLLVSNPATNSVKRFDGRTGEYLGDFVAPGAGGLTFPTALAMGPDGRLYVGSGPGNSIRRYDGRTGEFLDLFVGPSDLIGPSDFAFHDGRLYVSEWNNSTFSGSVAAFDATTGAFIERVVTGVGRANGLAFDDDGHLYVSVFDNREVREYDPDTGQLLGSFTGDGFVLSPMDLAITPDGHLLVSSFGDGTVRRFDLDTHQYAGVAAAGLAFAHAITLAPDGRLMAASLNEMAVRAFDPGSGDPLGVFAQGGGLGAPEKFTFATVPGPASGLGLALGLAVLRRRRPADQPRVS